MAKTNYSKVEQALDEGLKRLSVDKLLEYSDVSSKLGQTPSIAKQGRLENEEAALRLKQDKHLLVASMQFDINRLFKKNKHLYTKLGTHHEEITSLFNDIDTLTEDRLKRLLEIKKSLDDYKAKLKEKKPDSSNDAIVEHERKKHINKRFNVKDKWLPLY